MPIFFLSLFSIFRLFRICICCTNHYVVWQTAEMSDVEQLEAMASVDVPVVVAADNSNANANENGNGVNGVEDAAVNHVDDVDDEVTDRSTAPIND